MTDGSFLTDKAFTLAGRRPSDLLDRGDQFHRDELECSTRWIVVSRQAQIDTSDWQKPAQQEQDRAPDTGP